MTWSLSAAGHALVEQGEDYLEKAKEVEQRLLDELKAVLSKPEYNTTSSTFNGNTVSGQAHEAATTSAPETPSN